MSGGEIVIPTFDDDEETPSFLSNSSSAGAFQPFHFHQQQQHTAGKGQSHSQQSSFSGPSISLSASNLNANTFGHGSSNFSSSSLASGNRPRGDSDALSRPNYARKGSFAFQQQHQQQGNLPLRKESVSTPTHPAHSNNAGNSEAIEQALYIVLESFFEKADEKMADCLSRPVATHDNQLAAELQLPRILGKGVDPSFDRVLDAIAHIGRKMPKTVVDVVMRWRKSQGEGVDHQLVNKAMSSAGAHTFQTLQSHTSNSQALSRQTVADILSERKALASIYILCRALICIVEAVNVDTLGDELVAKLEDIIFNSLKNADPLLVERSANRRANMDLYAHLIGSLSNIRFLSMSDRFVADLNQVLQGNIAKEAEPRLEHLIRGMRFVKLQIYPMELFEEATEFLEALANIFEAASGARIKTALANTLTNLLSPVVLTATAEVNHPVWAKASTLIYTRAAQMVTRPRYIGCALPLMCAAAGSSPEEGLLANFNNCVELCLPRLKEKGTRATAFHSLLHLVWAYLRRCHETHGNVAKRLDPIIKTVFPAQRRQLGVADLPIDTASYLPHLITTRFLEYGTEIISSLIHPMIPQISTERWPLDIINPERMYVAIQAVLLTCDSLEQGKDPHMPPQPPLSEFDEVSTQTIPPLRLDAMPDALYNRAGLKTLLDTCSVAVAKIIMTCDRASENFSLLDDRNIVARNQQSLHHATTTADTQIVKRHGPFMVTYPKEKQPLFDLQRVCIEAWPRLLPRNSNIADLRPVDILLRCLVHVDMDIYNAAKRAMERMVAYKDGHLVLRSLSRFVVRPELKVRETGSLQGATTVKLESLVGLWSDLVRIYTEHLDARNAAAQNSSVASRRMPSAADDRSQTNHSHWDETDPRAVWPIIGELEAAALVHLAAQSTLLRRRAVEVLRGVKLLQKSVEIWSDNINGTPIPTTDLRVINVLEDNGLSLLAEIEDDSLNQAELNRLTWWRKNPKSHEILPKIVESDNLLDLVLWHYIWPYFLTACQDTVSSTVSLARPFFASRLLKAYPAASAAASLVPNKVPPTPSTIRAALPNQQAQQSQPVQSHDIAFLADHWKTHLMALCAITLNTTASSPVALSSVEPTLVSDVDRLATGSDIIRLAVPFLASDSLPFREAVIRGLGCSNITMYKALLDGLGSIVRHLMEDHRMRSEQRGSQMRRSARHGRLHHAVARVQELSSRLLRQTAIGDNEVQLVAQYIKDALALVRDPEAIDEASSLSMRRAFCMCVCNFVDYCSTQKSIKSLLPVDVRHALYALFDSWSFRPLSIASPDTSRHGSRSSDIHTSGHHHSKSRASSFGSHSTSSAYDVFVPAINANVGLCECDALVMKREHSEKSGILEAQEVLRWAQALFESSSSVGHSAARKAIGGLIACNLDNRLFLDATVYQCFAEPDNLPLQQSTFSVLSGAIIAEPVIAIKASTAICLALWKIGQTDLPTRQRALDIIALKLTSSRREAIVVPNQAAVYSTFSGAILQARSRLSAAIANAEVADSRAVFLELAIRILQVGSKQTRLLMQLLPPWLSLISFPNTNSSSQSSSSITDPVLANLFLLSAKYSDVYQIEIRAMWRALADAQSPTNLGLIIAFLVHESSIRGSKEFTRHAQRIIGCLGEADLSSLVLDQLGDAIQPATLVLSSDPSSSQPAANKQSTVRRTNLDTLFPINPRRLPMSPAQAAMLLVGDAVLERLSTADPNVIRILHILIMHVDHGIAFIRSQARDIVVRILTLLSKLDRVSPGQSGTQANSVPTFSGPAEVLWPWRAFWETADHVLTESQTAQENMQALIADALRLLERRVPDSSRLWSLVALEWAIACPLRHIACRSLQILRSLNAPVSESMLADLLARLSNTISDTSLDAQLFAQEILLVLRKAAAQKGSTFGAFPQPVLERLPQIWWAALACVCTPNEKEFVHVARLIGDLGTLLRDAQDISSLLDSQPEEAPKAHSQVGIACLRGFRSSVTLEATWEMLKTIACIPSDMPDVFDHSQSFGILFAATLIYGLEALEEGAIQSDFEQHTENMCAIATALNQDGYTRVMRSLGKNRFRTKDDFVRQSIGAIREYCSNEVRVKVLLLYLGCLQNATVWLRKRALVLLRQLLRQITFTEDDLRNTGKDLLAPLMQLLTTEMAPLALEIFDEPSIPFTASASQTNGLASRPSTADTVNTRTGALASEGTCFGQVHPTGWSCPSRDRDADSVRTYLRAVAATCGARPLSNATNSPFAFASDDDGNITPQLLDNTRVNADPLGDPSGLGDMVTTLHDLGSFFDEADVPASPAFRMSTTTAASASRVAAVLARSHKAKDFTMDVIPETPTPFSAAFAMSDTLHDDQHQHQHHMMSSDEYDDDTSLDYGKGDNTEDEESEVSTGKWEGGASASSTASSPRRVTNGIHRGKWEF